MQQNFKTQKSVAWATKSINHGKFLKATERTMYEDSWYYDQLLANVSTEAGHSLTKPHPSGRSSLRRNRIARAHTSFS